jgi:DNA-binding NarL/FixJ family response regulator
MHPSVFKIPGLFRDDVNINILLMLAMGKSHEQIGKEIFRSAENIEYRIMQMNDALGIKAAPGHKRTDARLIAEVMRLKIID